MSQIPSFIQQFIESMTQPGALSNATGFKVMAATRQRLAELQGTNGNVTLTADELDDTASGCQPEINRELTADDIAYLADKLAQFFFEMARGFEQAGFADGKRMAIKLVQKFTLKF